MSHNTLRPNMVISHVNIIYSRVNMVKIRHLMGSYVVFQYYIIYEVKIQTQKCLILFHI